MPTRPLIILLAILGLNLGTAQAQGKLARVVSTIIHDDGSKTLSNRDLVKRTMQQETYSPRGVLQMKRIFQLDREGKVRSGLAFDGAGKPVFKFKYVYDDLDRLSEEQIHDMKDQRVRLMKTVYDDQGKGSRVAITDANPKSLKASHRDIMEHPERLEANGKKVPGNQLAK
ncbi:MAG: hypothetical protein ACI8T1_003494 [Verrucomicrobiales bacterium]|jgi:hypothetical protein